MLILMAMAVAESQAQLQFEPNEPLPPVIIARPGAVDTLDLTACVDLALAQNERLRAERQRRAELDGQKYQALSTGLPDSPGRAGWTGWRRPVSVRQSPTSDTQPGPRTTRPGSAPVCWPSRQTGTPFTKTCATPVASWWGFS